VVVLPTTLLIGHSNDPRHAVRPALEPDDLGPLPRSHVMHALVTGAASFVLMCAGARRGAGRLFSQQFHIGLLSAVSFLGGRSATRLFVRYPSTGGARRIEACDGPTDHDCANVSRKHQKIVLAGIPSAAGTGRRSPLSG